MLLFIFEAAQFVRAKMADNIDLYQAVGSRYLTS